MKRCLCLLCLFASLAQAAPGDAYERGRALRQRDSTRAYALIRQAAVAGNPEAMFTLSNMLQSGEGTPSDGAASRRWLEAAAELDNPQALQQLALHLQDGAMGYERDPERSAQLMREAAHALKHRGQEH